MHLNLWRKCPIVLIFLQLKDKKLTSFVSTASALSIFTTFFCGVLDLSIKKADSSELMDASVDKKSREHCSTPHHLRSKSSVSTPITPTVTQDKDINYYQGGPLIRTWRSSISILL
jgi:hypothetical protein